MNLNGIVNWIADLLVWSFDNILIPIAHLWKNPSDLILLLGFVGLFIWLKMQGDFNKEAAANPDQIK